MKTHEDLEADLATIFREQWTTIEKQVVPAPTDLPLNSNVAGHFGLMTILYADLNGSTKMVDTQSWAFSAEIYKAYLHCAAHIIRNQGGVITAYDGDRIMSVFTGESKNSDAVTCAFKINHAVLNIINPAIRRVYAAKDFTVKHTVGIDTSEIHVARVGVRNDSDLVWIGRAANHAAKLTALSSEKYSLWISKSVYDAMQSHLKNFSNGAPAWEKWLWSSMDNAEIYGSNGAIGIGTG
jgi:class 3 adenylate cyclase